jgi:signal transduction histidine kinase
MMYNEVVVNMSSSRRKGATGKLSTARTPSKLGGRKREVLAAERLEAAARLTAWVAHQINNPLGAISGSAQLLARCLERDIHDPDALKEYMRYLDAIRDQIERCARITGEMQSFTQSGEPDLRPVEIPSLLREAVDVITYAFPSSDVRLSPIGKPDLPRGKADREWISRILFELLSNAVEASDGRQVWIRAKAGKEFEGCPSNIHIEVVDSGKGIDAEVLPRIFDPFFSTREKARGLGLTLALEMVGKMGGSLQISKSNSSGSIFVVSIPAWGCKD